MGHKRIGSILIFTLGTAMLAVTGCGVADQGQAPRQEQQVQAGQESLSDPAEPDGQPGTGQGQAGSGPGDQAAGTGHDTGGDGSGEIQAGTITADLAGGVRRSITVEAEDLEADYTETAVQIQIDDTGIQVTGSGTWASGSTVTIQKGGTYVVSGTLSDGQICIDADQNTVHLVLDGVNLTSQTTAPIYRKDKGKTILTLAEGSRNVVQDQTPYQYAQAGEDEPDAPLFFKGDLTINGTGTLEVAGNYQCGIRSKEHLMVVSGTVRIRSADDGLKGKESVVILGGDLDIQAGKDGIKSSQDADDQAGFIWIDGGTITIAADDDGIQAETALIIRDGQIRITRSQEALAGKTVDILGGVIYGEAEDDGINSAAAVDTEREKMQNQEGVYTRIAGGEVHLNARADGIDSNGNLYIEGGTLYLTGPSDGGNGILDYNGDAALTGGTVFAAGTSSMMQTFGQESTQNYLVVYWEEPQEAGTPMELTDAEGKVLGSYTPEKPYEAAIISVPELTEGTAYYVTAGETRVEMTVEGIETVSGTPSSGPGGRGMGGHGGMERSGRGELPEGMERPEGKERPEGSEGRKGKKRPEGAEPPERGERPEGAEPPERRERPEGAESPEGPEDRSGPQ